MAASNNTLQVKSVSDLSAHFETEAVADYSIDIAAKHYDTALDIYQPKLMTGYDESQRAREQIGDDGENLSSTLMMCGNVCDFDFSSDNPDSSTDISAESFINEYL